MQLINVNVDVMMSRVAGQWYHAWYVILCARTANIK